MSYYNKHHKKFDIRTVKRLIQDFQKQKPSSMDLFMSYYVVLMTFGVSFPSFIGENRIQFSYCNSYSFEACFSYEIVVIKYKIYFWGLRGDLNLTSMSF